MHPVGAAVRTALSEPRYAAMSAAVFASLMFASLLAGGFVFVEPYLVAHIPEGYESDLALLTAVSAAAALVLPVSVRRAVRTREARSAAGGTLGACAGAAAGACASCGPVGLALASAFGGAGFAAVSFLVSYEAHLQVAAIAVLGASLWLVSRPPRSLR